MGTRIHKTIGWGLNNIQVKDLDIVDSRINTDFFKSEDYWNKEGDIEGFFQWIKDNREECEQIIKEVEPNRWTGDRGREEEYRSDIGITLAFWERAKRTNSSAVIHDAEYGMGEVLLFSPVNEPDFCRYDDIIDYYEANAQMENHIKMLTSSCGIYPYLGMVHLPGAPNFGKEKYRYVYNPSEYNQMVGAWSPTMKPLLTGDMLEYFKKYYRPTIPSVIILHAYWLNIFNDFKKTIQELRPMIYTYWG